MSAWVWRPGEFPETWVTGEPDVGACVSLGSTKRWIAEAWWKRREVRERGIGSLEEAKTVASEWLDRREAEGRGEPAAKPEPKPAEEVNAAPTERSRP